MLVHASPAARILSAAGALLLCLSHSLAAQGVGIVRGRVTDAASGRPIADATVTIAGRSQGALTSASGDYTIANVAAGTAAITARRIGYGRNTRQITVASGT